MTNLTFVCVNAYVELTLNTKDNKVRQGKITLLGTGTCQLQKHRMASSVLIELEDLKIIYDMGRGICQRLIDCKLNQDDVQHIVFSHFHPDHLSDLIPFLHAAMWSQIDPRRKDLYIYGPPGIKEQVEKILNLFETNALSGDKFDISVSEVRDETLTIDGRDFLFVDLPPASNHGLKFVYLNKVYAVTGDSDFHEQEVEFLKNVDLAIIDSGHLADEEIVELTVSSRAKKIVCSHLYQEPDAGTLSLRAKKKGYRGEIIIGEDLMTFDLA